MMRFGLLLFVLGLFIRADQAGAQSSSDWAECIVSQAPVSATSWLGTGGPETKSGDDDQRKANNLSFRLKAICAQFLSPSEDVAALEFKASSVFRRVSRIIDRTPIPANANEAPFESAGYCSTYFFYKNLDEVGDDAAAVEQAQLDGASMSFSGYEIINPEVPNPFLVDVIQSNGAQGKMFGVCQAIQSDGTLTNA